MLHNTDIISIAHFDINIFPKHLNPLFRLWLIYWILKFIYIYIYIYTFECDSTWIHLVCSKSEYVSFSYMKCTLNCFYVQKHMPCLVQKGVTNPLGKISCNAMSFAIINIGNCWVYLGQLIHLLVTSANFIIVVKCCLVKCVLKAQNP